MGIAMHLQFRWNDNVIEQLKQFVAEGMSFSRIGAELGCSRNAACGKAFRLGLTSKIRRTGGRKPRPAPIGGTKRQRLTNRGTRFQMETVTVYGQPEPTLVDIEPLNIPLLDLEPDHCRWPIGDGPFVFCGHPQHRGSSYCRTHFELSCGPGSYGERQALPVMRRRAA